MLKGLQKLKNKKGFTLVELIVVIAIIGVLAAILVPLMSNYLTSARLQSATATASSIKTAVTAAIQEEIAKGRTVTAASAKVATYNGTTWSGTDTLAGTGSKTLGGILNDLLPPTVMGSGVASAFASVTWADNAATLALYATGTTSLPGDFATGNTGNNSKKVGAIYVGSSNGAA